MPGHYFFALTLPNEVKLALKDASNHIRKEFPFKKWVHYEDFHVTLTFLGQAEKKMLDDSINGTRKALGNFPSFPLRLNGTGLFGSNKSPRVLWTGTEHSVNLHQVQQLTNDACEAAGFQLEKRPYKPHITIARTWMGERPFSTEELKNYQAEVFSENEFLATEVGLYEVHPEQIPKYEKIESFKLLT